MAAFAPMFMRFVEARLATRDEVDELPTAADAALSRGELEFTFVMFVASGRVPD